MGPFCIRCAIFLLLVLSRKFSEAHWHNSDRESPSAKILTKYLKMPWMKSVSSWPDDVKSVCQNDIETLFESADDGHMWALQMLDASSKIPSGILTGNIRDLGMYDECIRVTPQHNSANIQGRHCMVSMSMPTKFVRNATAILFIQKQSAYNPTPEVEFNFAASLCLPSSCGVEDVASFVNASIQSTPELSEFEVKVAQVICSRVESETRIFTLGTILTLSFIAVVIGFQVFCTVCDFVRRMRSDSSSPSLEMLAKFSLYTNAIKLSSTEIPPETFPAVNGIRFVALFMVVTGHRILTSLVKPAVNISDGIEMWYSWITRIIMILPYSVDTFFLISGFLTAYMFLKALHSGIKINLLEIYVYRYLRLTPCVAVLVLLQIFVSPHFGSGPIWDIVVGLGSDFCRKNWWTNLLHIQNIVNNEEMCLGHTWYVAAEIQLFFISPIVLYPLFHRPKRGLAMLSGLLIAAFCIPVIQIVFNQSCFFFDLNKPSLEKYENFVNFSMVTYYRALPYFLGIFLGYYVTSRKNNLTKLQVSFGWFLTCVFFAFCFWNTQYVQPHAVVYNAVGEMMYISLSRLGWSLATAWTIYACTHGYGGSITRFLSLPIFVPLSRLGYNIYLLSIMIQVGMNSMIRTAEFGSGLAMIYLIWSDLVISIMAAFVFSLCFESPVVVLLKIWKAKRLPPAILRPAAITEKEKLSAIIEEYLKLATGRPHTDLSIKSRSSDFWRTVSAMLHSSGRKSSKTPAQWAEVWQDWKRDFSKNNIGSEVSVRENRKRSQAEVTSLEEELLIFLAVMSCGSKDSLSWQTTTTAEHVKSR